MIQYSLQMHLSLLLVVTLRSIAKKDKITEGIEINNTLGIYGSGLESV